MKALIAFIVMAAVILTLIEINERRKAKKNRGTGTQESRDPEACEKTDVEDCSGCGLINVCEKEKKTGR